MTRRKTPSQTGQASTKPPRFSRDELVMKLHGWLLTAAGARSWWPCDRAGPHDGRDEIIIGAVLTQNTAWTNVEKALDNLKAKSLCDLSRLARFTPEEIAPFIRPSGYYNLKARRLKALADFFAPGGKVRFEELVLWDDDALRKALLEVHGVGPETADSVLLYALGRLSFVIDAYTLRIGRRHGLLDEKATYEEARSFFSRHTPPECSVYNEYHALLVWVGNRYCKPKPRCSECPLSCRESFASHRAWQALAPYRQST